MSVFRVNWTDPNGVAKITNVTQTDSTPDPSKPVVLLLHGGGGDIHDMSDPATHPGVEFDVDFVPPAFTDRGWHPYPNIGIWSIFTSPPKGGRGLQGALEQSGYRTLNYAQLGPDDSIQIPAPELDAVVRAVLARFSNQRLIFVCHSRGGLLARFFLQRNREDLNVLSRLAGIVTLHSPHLGSEVADFATNVHNAITTLRLIFPLNLSFNIALGFLDRLVNQGSIPELRPSSQFLATLRAGEASALQVAIPIHTFGGTNPRLLSVFVSQFNPSSLVPHWNWPPFHWSTSQMKALDVMDGTPVSLICPEERPGGDVLVTDFRTRLLGEASHSTNPLNHTNVLCDANIQSKVQDLLQTMRSNASFVTQAVPSSMVAGVTYPVSITMRNNGTSTWVTGVNCPFRLGSQNPQDNSVWGISRKDVPGSIAPGATATFNFSVTAPAAAGSHHFQWRMLQENIEWFGGATPDVVVQVTQPATVSGLTPDQSLSQTAAT